MLHNLRYRGEGGMYTNLAKTQKGAEPVWKWIPAMRNNPQALVSPEIWNLAQEKLTENQSQSARNRQHNYLLSTLLVCCEPHTHVQVVQRDGSQPGRKPKTAGMCGRLFLGRTVTKKNQSYGYYYCSREGACTSKPLRQTDVEKAVWDVVAAAQRSTREEFIEETFREVDHSRLVAEAPSGDRRHQQRPRPGSTTSARSSAVRSRRSASPKNRPMYASPRSTPRSSRYRSASRRSNASCSASACRPRT